MGFDFGSFLSSVPVVGNVLGGAYDQITGQGNYNSNSNYGPVNADTDAQRALRDQFANQYSALKPGGAPGISSAQINTDQSDQARDVQMSGLKTVGQGVDVQKEGLGTQHQGADLQKQGAGVEQEGLGTQQHGIDVQQGGLAGLQAGFGQQLAAGQTAGAAAQSYQDVLAGKTPSVAELSAQKLAGQNIASAYGGAASATGGNRAMALRSAINGAGELGAQTAANAGIQRAAEQDAARAGLTGAAGAQANAGAGLSNTGSAISNVGQGITSSGQGISATGAGIANTGAGLANTGQGISATGAGIVNSGATQSGIGTATRGQDLSSATDQAQLNQNAALANLGSKLTSRGQDISQQSSLGGLALGSAAAPPATDINLIDQQRADKNQGQTNQSTLFNTTGTAISFSSEDVKTDIKPVTSGAVKQLFDAEDPGDATARAAAVSGASSVSRLFSSLGGTGGPSALGGTGGPSVGSGGIGPSQVKQPSGGVGGPGLGQLAGAAGSPGGQAGLAALFSGSSKQVKTDVQTDPAEARRMFAQIVPTTWRYDGAKLAAKGLPEPDTEGKDHLGVIAENVEKAGPLGKGIVVKKNGVKGLDIPMAVSALMAAVADIERRGGRRAS